MRKASGGSRGANKRAGRSGLVLVCGGGSQDVERRLEVESLVWGEKSAPLPEVAKPTDRGGLDLQLHAAAPARKGGERSWSWVAVNSRVLRCLETPSVTRPRNGWFLNRDNLRSIAACQFGLVSSQHEFGLGGSRPNSARPPHFEGRSRRIGP